MQITVSHLRTTDAQRDPGGRRALLLGARFAGHDVFGLCCRLVARSTTAVHLDQVAAVGLRKAWHADGTLALLSAGWDSVLMLESAARIAADPSRYASLARVLSFAARSAGAQVALVQPPRECGLEQWETIATAVDAAALGAHADVVPVGAAWQVALTQRPGLPLLGDDGRLSVLGAYLVASTLAHYVSGRPLPPLDLPGVAARDIGIAHLAAQESMRSSPARCVTMEEGQTQ